MSRPAEIPRLDYGSFLLGWRDSWRAVLRRGEWGLTFEILVRDAERLNEFSGNGNSLRGVREDVHQVLKRNRHDGDCSFCASRAGLFDSCFCCHILRLQLF